MFFVAFVVAFAVDFDVAFAFTVAVVVAVDHPVAVVVAAVVHGVVCCTIPVLCCDCGPPYSLSQSHHTRQVCCLVLRRIIFRE